ncbi:YceI family protein [Pseudorhodoplanes sp.]|uniref:YceI family protein n=1 Tax=Pseudorhodoplanes sp. TaxID=1934341 RepID=UPI003D0DED37
MMEATRRFILCAAALLGAAVMAFTEPAAAEAPEWAVDFAKSSIGFTGRQMGVPSKGRFKSFTATIKFDPGNLAVSSVEVIVDAASADAGNPDIDKELKQPKWFDVARFPTVRFVTTAFRAKNAEKGDYEAAARLTIRDVTEEVVLPFKLAITPDPADPGQLVARVTGELTISRTKFGVGRDEWRDTKIVGDEVGLTIDVLARRKK